MVIYHALSIQCTFSPLIQELFLPRDSEENRLTTSNGCRQSSASVMCRVFSNTSEIQSQRGRSGSTDRINIFLLEKEIAAGFLYQTAALFIPNYCFSNKILMKM